MQKSTLQPHENIVKFNLYEVESSRNLVAQSKASDYHLMCSKHSAYKYKKSCNTSNATESKQGQSL